MKDDLSSEQFTLYPHGSYLASIDSSVVANDPIPIIDVSSRKQSRSLSDSEQSTEPLADSGLNLTRKRNNLSESDINNESTGINNSSISPPSSTTNTNKSNLARTAILLAAKRAADGNTSNNSRSTFTLIDGTQDEADSNGGLFKQCYDTIDLTDEVNSFIDKNSCSH